MGEEPPLDTPLPEGHAPQPPTQLRDEYSQFVLLFVYANLLSSLFTEVRGDGFVALIGSYNLSSTDIAVLSGVPMVLKAIQQPNHDFSYSRVLLLGWIGVVAFWLARAMTISPFSALFSFRVYAAYCAAVLAFSLKPVDSATYRKICLAFIWTGLALTALALLRVAFGSTLFLRPDTGAMWGYTFDGRPINAPAALILGEAVIFAMSLPQARITSLMRGFNENTAIAIALIIGLLTTGQRTVAAAAGIGIAIMAIDKTRARFRGLVNPVTVLGGLLVVVVLASVSPQELLSMLPKSFTSGNAMGDFQFRLLIWASIIQNFLSWPVFTQLFGKADTWNLFWYLELSDRLDARSAHNELFGALLFTGALGVLLIIGAVAVCFFGTMLARMRGWVQNISGLSPALVMALVAVLMIYGVSYEWQYEQGIIVGLCVAGWARQEVQRQVAGEGREAGASGE